MKNKIEELTIKFAVKKFDFDFAIVFYDVTTLYFETFKADDFRKTGFSKGNKSNQPQIVVGLVVNKEGFPVAYELFPGNTFEGHTLIPIIKDFKKKHNIKNLTVVADAAMISTDNIDNLKTADKYEMDKQIAKAKEILQSPRKSKKVKFIKTTEAKNELNSELINKTNTLLGIKGYHTNLDEKTFSNELVTERYHQLYKIEQAFRISKHDLKTRPIFHFKEDPIRLHVLICFMALSVPKYIEIETNMSIHAFLFM